MKSPESAERQWHSEFKMLRGHLRARQRQALAEAAAATGDPSSLEAQTGSHGAAGSPVPQQQSVGRWPAVPPATPGARS